MTNDNISFSDLLPDYMHGRLSAEDVIRVETALKTNSDLSAELEFLKQISSTLKSSAGTLETDELGWAKLSRSIDAEKRPQTHNTSRFWKYAAIALAVISVGQATLFIRTFSGDAQKDRYVTVTQTPAKPFTMTLSFNPEATEHSIRDLMHATHAEIIAGPSKLGLYTLRFKTENARKSALDIYTEMPGIIETSALD